MTYDCDDPVWYFTAGTGRAPSNFVGPVGAFLAEVSFQLLGYTAYLMPLIIGDCRLALLLVPEARRAVHQGHRRRAVLRLRLCAAQPRPRPRPLPTIGVSTPAARSAR